MKKSTRLTSLVLCAMMTVSAACAVSFSASAAKVKKPTGVKAANTASGIKITWKKVKGAKKYQVFRGKKKIKTTKKKFYTDKKAKAGKTYTYSVKAFNGKKLSKKSKSVKVVRLTKPVFTLSSELDNMAYLGWKKVKGAKMYHIYRNDKKLASVTELNYTDSEVKKGVTYKYKIKAVNGKSTSVYSAQAEIEIPEENLNVKAKIEGDKVVLSWNKSEDASYYQIYRQRAGMEMGIRFASTRDNTYTDDLGPNPDAFTYTVYAINFDNTEEMVLPSGNVSFVYIPEGCYKTDENGNLRINITLNRNEFGDYIDYYAGREYTSSLDLSSFDITIDEESSKVISVDDGVISAVAAGKAEIKIELKTEAVKNRLYTAACAAAGKEFNNKLSTGIIYIDVTVEQ